ncbi:DNA/RNA non-specific endonuclease [Weissella soli]|uniref:DNA/RNA non-specific endonuclease n=1 Tax=Weissella soli TaxID=155866 RepID=UPI0035A19942
MKKNIVPILVISVLTSTVLLHTTPVNAATDAPLKYTTKKQLKLGNLDRYQRASTAHIQVSANQLPRLERTALTYNPIGWHNYHLSFDKNSTKKAWLFDRGHLIGYELSGLNNVPRNLTIETHYLNAGSVNGLNANNINGMLFYENKLTTWVKNNPSYRLDYQVTPQYSGAELIPRHVRLTYVGYSNNGKLLAIKLGSSKEKRNSNGTTTVTLDNVSFNAKINYTTGTATGIINPVVKKPTLTIKTFAGVKLANQRGGGYTIKITESKNSHFIGYAKPNQIVYVASNGTSKVYWFNKTHMSSRTNKSRVKNMTLQNALNAGKRLSITEHN